MCAITADVLAAGKDVPACCCNGIGPIIIGSAGSVSSPDSPSRLARSSSSTNTASSGDVASASDPLLRSVPRWPDIIAATACITAKISEFSPELASVSASALTGAKPPAIGSVSVSAATTPPKRAANSRSCSAPAPFFAKGWAKLALGPLLGFDAISDIRFWSILSNWAQFHASVLQFGCHLAAMRGFYLGQDFRRDASSSSRRASR